MALRCRCSAPVLFALTLGTAACGDDTADPTGDTGSSAGGTSGTPTTGEAPTGTSGDVPPAGTTTSGEPPGTTTAPDPTTGGGSTGGTTDETTGGVDPAEESAAMWERGKLATFDITLSPDAIASLDADPKLYVPGDLTATVDGEVHHLSMIAVRLKGNYGSLRTLDQKAAFLLNFDRYVDKQKLLGLEKLAVNNMVQDPSQQREQLAYELFREGGVAAPRAGHAVVTVNGEPYGVYTLVESVDNEEYLEHWFGDAGGNLYEGAYGSDVFADLIGSFDQDNGDNIDFLDLKELAQNLDGIADPADFVAEAGQWIDLDNYLTVAATEIYLGHWDGYAWTRNNFYVYRDPADDRWRWMPWGVDQVMVDNLDPFGGQGRISQMCAASLECRLMLAEKFEQVVARVDALQLAAEAQTLADAIRDAVEADPRKETDMNGVDGTVAANIAFLQSRGQNVLDALICADPASVDGDGDGYSGCGEDCDDGDDKVHPGAVEVCDLDDDNCDGVWDNSPQCPQCIVKNLPAPNNGKAAFCFGARPWAEAEADCVEQGGHLISIHNQTMQTFVSAEAFAIQGSDWWHGLNDVAVEGTFVWADGSPVNFMAWADGEPNNAGDEDCANFIPWGDGKWNDLPCDQARPYVCRLP